MKRTGDSDDAGEKFVKGFFRLSDMTRGGEYVPRNRFDAALVEIEYGLFGKGGRGTVGEVLITWHSSDGGRSLHPKIHAYGDSFDALWQLRAVLRGLAKKPNVGPDELCALLTRLDFTDFTISETPWVAHESTGTYFAIREGVFVLAPMSASPDVKEPHPEEVVEVDYDSTLYGAGAREAERLRTIERALRSGDTTLKDLKRYESPFGTRATAATKER